ncbi:MAG: PKD domain-containing protein, partial [Gammaproteobacteria bacterium]|nr:PKD domain-containing protein [Gammaproteobacteria bacterium]
MWGEIRGVLSRWTAACLLPVLLSACFHESNHPPTANAGANVVVAINELVKLDGSASSDVDGDHLRYVWDITEKPADSNAALIDAGSSNPQLTVDMVGIYTIRLVVSDGSKSSKPDFVSITTFNEKPTAVIREVSVPNGAHYIIGDTIQLDASLSTDPENESLFYNWELTIKPQGSNAVLSSDTAISPFFTVDQPGHYIVHLIANDGTNLSEPKMMIFEIEQPVRKTNTKPFAEAGPDQPLFAANTMIRLDGSGSYDVENDPLNYRWELIFKPPGSHSVLTSTSGVSPEFVADVLGSYVAKLVVSDVDGESHLDTVVITPHDEPQLACGDCHDNNVAQGRPENHLLTYDDCFQCHFIDKWKPAKGITHFHSHNAQPAQCEICHNGTDAGGKNEGHVVTDKDCNYCHQLSNGTWVPAYNKPVEPEFSHKGIYYNCIACHDNQFQQGKPEGHMPVSDRCFACHLTTSWQSDLHLEHTQVFENQCNLCHNGRKASGKATGHIATQSQCSEC